MNISLAPITRKRMMNAVNIIPTERLFMAQITLSRYFGICREVGRFRFVKSSASRVSNCASPSDLSWKVGSCFANS